MSAHRLAILGTRGIPASYGGFETFAQELSSNLSARGIEVTVYCPRKSGVGPAQFRGARLAYVRAPRLGPISTMVYDCICLWRARRRFDIVYVLGYGAAFFCFVPRIWGGQVWINMDGLEWARSKWSVVGKAWLRFMERVAMVTPNAIVADAVEIRRSLRTRHRRTPKCYVVPYGAEVPVLPREDLLRRWGVERRAYWLIVCRLEPENHVREIIEGYLASNRREPIVVVGDICVNTEYARLLRTCSSQLVRFVGTVYSRPQLDALRFHCKGYFHGHSVGGTNPSLLEAMACSGLIIAHDNAFNREVAAGAALYFDSAEAIPNLLRKIDRADFDADGFRERALARVTSKYSWDTVCAKYLQMVQESLA